MRTPKHLWNRNIFRNQSDYPCPPRRDLPTRRIVYLLDSVSIWAWPSRGGLIVLERATGLDFEFLGLDPIHSQLRRDPDQDVEDRLCQRLLLLGAKWFDSQERYGFVSNVADDSEHCILALEEGEEPRPTTMERRWVSVGFPGGRTDGGLWVLEYDTNIYGIQEKHNLVPAQAAQVYLARTMNEKCEILKNMGAKFFESPEQYSGAACIKAWNERTEGEFRPLVKTQYERESEAYITPSPNTHDLYVTPKPLHIPALDHTDSTHTKTIFALASTSTHLITGSQDHTLRIWSKSTLNLAFPPLTGHPSAVVTLEVSEPLGVMFSGDSKGNLILWDLNDGEKVQQIDQAHEDTVLAMACLERHLVTAGRDGYVKVWDIKDGGNPARDELHVRRSLNLKHTLPGHEKPVLGVRITGDGQRVVSTAGDRTLRIWELWSGRCLRALEGLGGAMVRFEVLGGEDGMHVVGACTDGKVRVYGLDEGREVACLEGHCGVVRAVKMVNVRASTGRVREKIISASYDGTVRIWGRNEDGDWATVNILSFTDAVLNKFPNFSYADAEEGFLSVDQKPSKIMDMEVDDHRIYCCGDGREIICWNLKDVLGIKENESIETI